ncbi:MAG: hypothetical protein ACJA0K_001519 [Maricaulis maris]|jgi:hypothetical protein
MDWMRAVPGPSRPADRDKDRLAGHRNQGANIALAGSMAVQMVKTSFLRQAVDG